MHCASSPPIPFQQLEFIVVTRSTTAYKTKNLTKKGPFLMMYPSDQIKKYVMLSGHMIGFDRIQEIESGIH